MMANQKEVDDLQQRMTLLGLDAHLELFELMLADYRRARATDSGAARQELAARDAWSLQQQQAADRGDQAEA